MKKKENGAAVALDVKKASVKELQAYLAEVLPNFDRDRVYVSDIKKLITWYNLLVASGMTDFEEVAEEAAEKGCCRIICFGFRHPAFIFLTLTSHFFVCIPLVFRGGGCYEWKPNTPNKPVSDGLLGVFAVLYFGCL